MAVFKHKAYLKAGDHRDFDRSLFSGDKVPQAGIYRCVPCGHEIAAEQGGSIPGVNHHQHTLIAAKHQWLLVVAADRPVIGRK